MKEQFETKAHEKIKCHRVDFKAVKTIMNVLSSNVICLLYISDSCYNKTLSILWCKTLRTSESNRESKEIGIVIEDVQVIAGPGDIARACSVLLDLTYTLNLNYLTQLKYTFEVFQKPFLELQDSKLSNKVQALKSKLLA